MQLERPYPPYAALVSDAVVGLACLSMTLGSRRRLVANGTIERVGRLLARGMLELKHEREGNRGELVKNLVGTSPGDIEGTRFTPSLGQ